jgi:hypothetical protein
MRRYLYTGLAGLLLIGVTVHAMDNPVSLQLAVQLFEEEDWAGTRRECRRVLIRQPGHCRARLLDNLAVLRQGLRTPVITAGLQAVFNECTNTGIRCMAAYALGRERWYERDPEPALHYLGYTFSHTRNQDLFLHSACSLEFFFSEYPDILPPEASLRMQVATAHRLLWQRKLREECRMQRGGNRSWLALPGSWVTSFYRAQIRPAIGDRCLLQPSCSAYFLQACHKHGLLGFSIYADRGVREPGVVSEARHPVMINGTIKYADPLEDHDWWMYQAREP